MNRWIHNRERRIVVLVIVATAGMTGVALALLSLAISGVGAIALVVITVILGSTAAAAFRLALRGAVEAEIVKSRSADLARSLIALEGRNEDLQRQLTDQRAAGARRERQLEALRNASAVIQRRIDELDQAWERAMRIAETAAKQRQDINRRLSRVRELTANARDQAGRAVDAAEDTRARLSTRLGQVEGRIRSDRSEWALNFARRDSSAKAPERVLIIVSIHRSGSTRLFDIIRTHQDVYVEPLAFLWKELNLEGRRYPEGLSDLLGAAELLEVQDGLGAAIPVVDPIGRSELARSYGRIALEKIHPQFYHFDALTFARRIDEVEGHLETSIDFVYLVRSPIDAMWSMAEYKRRVQHWYRDLPEEEIPDFIHRSFLSLSDLVRQRPGLVIDYSDIRRDSPQLIEVAKMLGDQNDRQTIKQWLDMAFSATSKKKLGETTFVGQRDPNRSRMGPDSVWEQSQSVIDAANSLHQAMLEGG